MTLAFIFLAFAVIGRPLSLPELLDRAAKAAQHEAVELSSVASTETVVETKLNDKDKVDERRRQTFNYLVMLDTEDGNLAVTESRVMQTGSKKVEDKPLLDSTGFATMALLLHPYYQDSFDFTDLGQQEQDGRMWEHIGFAFRPGKRSPSVLRAGSREYALAWKGDLLLDPATGQVLSIHAGLGSQLEEIGLENLDVTVKYAPPGGNATDAWLPSEATIDLKTHHQHWRNVHTFSDYKHFDVTTTEKQGAAQQP
jgi:hypothetical protein